MDRINPDYARGQANIVTVDIDLSTAHQQILTIPGDYLYVDQASTGYVRIECNVGAAGTLSPLTLAGGGSIDVPFQSLKISAPAQTGRTVRLAICYGARVKPGSPFQASAAIQAILDGESTRTANDQAFIGWGNRSASVGNISHVMLWNPAGSGKTLTCHRVRYSSGAAQTVYCAMTNTTASWTVFSGANNPANLRLASLQGGVVGVAQTWQLAQAGGIGTQIAMDVGTGSTKYDSFDFKRPVLIEPGYGLLLRNATANSDLSAFFEYFEGA